MKTVNDFAFQFATFSLQNITGLDAGLDGKIQTAVNIHFSQSNSCIWQFPVLVRQSHIIIRYINTRDNKKPYGNKDGYGWRRLTPIANDELDKFRLTFLGAGWTNSHAAPLKLLSATCGNATELESNVAICLIQFRNSLTGSF